MEELSAYQRAFLRKYPVPQLFSVVSWGCAATAWLANVLNRHPDIYCVHAANLSWHVLGNCEMLDGVQYLRIVGSQGHASRAAGGVHGLSRHRVPECRQPFGERFNAAVVVREPLARIYSQLALYEDFEGLRAWDVDYLDPVVERAGIPVHRDDYQSWLFVHAANMLNAILEDREVGKVYRCEDLTGRPDTLGEFVDEVTRGQVFSSPAWLQSAMQTESVNVHAGKRPGRPFSDWQIDVLRKIVDPRSWEIYETLGYPRPAFAA